MPGRVTVRGTEPIDADHGPLVDNLPGLSHETCLHGGRIGTPEVAGSASPTVVRERLEVGLPSERDQVHTRVAPRLAELRTRVYERIRAAKREAPGAVRKDTPPLR
ncbi:hypothetical protein SUDANB176_06408 [Streptomyces sp. enrichment culture]